MFAKVSKSVLAAVTLTILILSAVFYWFIGFGVWLPISLAGLGTGMDEAMFVIGGMAAAMTQAYVWAK